MNIMLDILGAALVVFVFLGYVRRVRLREPVRAPRPWGPVPERRVRDAVRKRRHIHARREPKRGQEDRDDEGSVSNPEKTITTHLAGSTRTVSFEKPRRPRIRVPGRS